MHSSTQHARRPGLFFQVTRIALEGMLTTREHGIRLVLCGVREQPSYDLKVTDLGRIFEIGMAEST